MRFVITFFLTALFALPSFGANETVLLLEAQRVRDAIYVIPDGETLKVKIDKENSSSKLEENTTYKAGKRIDIVFEGFNPLHYGVATSEKLRDDETAKAVADFLQKVIDTAGGVGLTPAQATAAAETLETQASRERATVQQVNAGTTEMLETMGDLPEDPCKKYKKLHDWLIQLRALMNVPIVTPVRFRTWFDGATSAEGVTNVRADMQAAAKELDDNAKAISDVLAAIRKQFRKSLDSPDLVLILQTSNLQTVLEGSKPRAKFRDQLESKDLRDLVDANGDSEDAADLLLEAALRAMDKDGGCNSIRASTFVALLDISRDAARIEAKKATVKPELVALHKSLEPYTDPSDWRSDNPKNYILLQPKPDGAKINNITVTITERVAPAGPISVVLTDKKPASGSFDLRKYSAVIGEVAAALIYTDITYKNFGTETKNGQITVQETEDSHFPVEGAMMMNLIPAFDVDSFVYPAFQLGVSSAKDAPGFLAGLALRFTGSKQLSVSIGRMVTWHKTLNKLHVNDVVTGTADIEADLKLKRAPVAWYGAIQYSF